MTTKELRALNAHAAEHVMGWTQVHTNHIPVGSFIVMPDGEVFINRAGMKRFSPTTDSADAMEVLKKCGSKTVKGTEFVCVSFSTPGNSILSKNGHWSVGRLRDGGWDGDIGNAETLELAICLFAKQIFSKSAP